MKTRSLLQILDEHLPLLPCPEVARRVIEAAASPHTSALDLEQIILHDPALAARMLRIANSAYYGLSQRINRIRQAIVLLGFQTTRNVAMTAALASWFRRGRRVGRVTGEDIWRHSLRVAVAAESIAQCLVVQAAVADAFLAGLLHDLGLLAEFELCPDELARVFQLQESRGLTHLQAERLVFGVDHSRATHRLLHRWSLPEELARAAGRHHAFETEGDGLDGLPKTVAAAEVLCARQGMFADGPAATPELLCAWLQIDAPLLDRLTEILKTRWEQARSWDEADPGR